MVYYSSVGAFSEAPFGATFSQNGVTLQLITCLAVIASGGAYITSSPSIFTRDARGHVGSRAYGQSSVCIMSARNVIRKCLEGLADEIFEMMAERATWSQWTEWLRVPLQHAAATGNQDIVHGLLMGGARANTIDDEGRTPLHFAAGSGRVDVVSTLLAHGAEENGLDGDDGNSALILAAHEGHLTVVNALLAANADPNIRNCEGYSALDRAAVEGHAGILKAILAHGADANAIDEDDGMSALHHAAASGEVGAIDVLVEAGSDIEMRTTTTTEGYTPLCCAAEESQSNTIVALMGHGANAEVRDARGRTLLHLVCRGQRGALVEAIDLLLRRGADEAAVCNRGRTPTDTLLSATHRGDCFQDDIDRAQLLLARAPADREWRRRCWLVMLRSRTSRAGRASYETGDAGDASSNTTGGEGRGGKSVKVAKGKRSMRGGHGEPEAASGGWNLAEIDGKSPGLRGLVGLLVGLEPEGVFRTVLGFL